MAIILIGLILGRMDPPAEHILSEMHELLQAAPDDPSVWPQLPLKQVPELQDHFGVDSLLYSRQSALAVESLDVTVRFSDGYIMTCHLPIAGGLTFISQCNEGDEIKQGP